MSDKATLWVSMYVSVYQGSPVCLLHIYKLHISKCMCPFESFSLLRTINRHCWLIFLSQMKYIRKENVTFFKTKYNDLEVTKEVRGKKKTKNSKESKEKQEMREEGKSQSSKNLLSPHQPSLLSIYKQKPSKQAGEGQRDQEKKDFPGGPVIKTLCFQYKGHGFEPWSGN